jgi:flagellar motor switch protein FliM
VSAVTGASAERPLTGESLQELFAARGGGVERLPLLREVMEKAASACTEEVRTLIGMPLRLGLDRVGSGTGADMLQGKGDRAFAVLDAPGWESKLLVRADRAAVFAIVETMLGSDCSQPPHVPDRALTALEVALAEFYFGALSRGLATAFAEVAATTFSIDPPMDQKDLEGLVGNMPVAIAGYRLDVGGELLVAIPNAALEAMRQPLSLAPAKAEARPDPGWAQQIRNQLTRADVTLTAILEERPGLLGEVLGLAVGQVIDLEATPQSRVRVECNGEALIWCDLGKSNGVYTLRVDSFVDREQEFMDDIRAA